MNIKRWLAVTILAAVLSTTSAFAVVKNTTEPVRKATLSKKDIETENNLGKEALASAEKSLKLTKDEKLAKRVETIGQEIAAIAKVTYVKATYGNSDLADFKYTFKVVDDKEINAFSLPAGPIYINKGLIDDVRSDDELAGVIAHEVAHIAHHHMLKLIKKQSQLNAAGFLVVFAAVIGKVQGTDMQNIFYGAQLLQLAKLNAYSRDAERDADSTAIQYLLASKYNPVGMLTFMERLAHKESLNPQGDQIFVTSDHPLSSERARSIESILVKNKVPVNRRAVAAGAIAEVKSSVVNGKTVNEVIIGKRVIFQPADTSGSPAATRAKEIADNLNRQLDKSPQEREVSVTSGTSVCIKQEPVITVTSEDALLAGTTPELAAKKAKDAIVAAIISDRMSRSY